MPFNIDIMTVSNDKYMNLNLYFIIAALFFLFNLDMID